jgi:hypothetical protein
MQHDGCTCVSEEVSIRWTERGQRLVSGPPAEVDRVLAELSGTEQELSARVLAVYLAACSLGDGIAA